MNNDMEEKKLEAFRRLANRPFLTIDVAMESILNSGMELSLPQEEHLRDVLGRLQHDAYELGYDEAMGWI